jgi:glycosyltransferase involved in cell wall biosynthesis
MLGTTISSTAAGGVAEDAGRPSAAEAEVAAVDATTMAELYAEVLEGAVAAGPLPTVLVVAAQQLLLATLLYVGVRNGAFVARGGRTQAVATWRPRRILLVINLLFWAGAETQLRNLAIGLRRFGHDVTLLAVEDITSHAEDLERAGVRMRTLGARDRVAKVRALPALFRASRGAEVVHCTGWDASLWGRLAAIAARRPVLVTEHAGDRSLQVSRGGAPRARLIALHNRLLDPATAATVIVSRAQAAQLEGEGVGPEKIVMIPNGVPVDELRRRAGEGRDRRALGIPPEARIVIHVARFATPKRQELTLRAVAALRERLGDVRAVFVGSGETEAAVKKVANEMGAEWATFLGSRDDVPALLRSADLAVLPSSAEGLPMSLIEAMAVGTPVVATDVGDVGWLLEKTGGGLCVDADDEAAFREACARVLGEEGLSERLRRAGMAGVEAFDAARMVESYADLFEAAIASRPAAAVREELVLET